MCNDVVGAVHLCDILVSSEDLLVVSKLRLGHGRLSALWHDLRRVASPLFGALYSFSGKHFLVAMYSVLFLIKFLIENHFE